MKFLRYADDLCIVAGLCLFGVGVYRICPVATWFYSGIALIGVGWLVARGMR